MNNNSKRIKLFPNNGLWDNSEARLFFITDTTINKDIIVRLVGESVLSSDLDKPLALFLKGGTPVDALEWLRDGDEVAADLGGGEYVKSTESVANSSKTVHKSDFLKTFVSSRSASPEKTAPTIPDAAEKKSPSDKVHVQEVEDSWPRIVTVSFFVNNIKKIDVIEGTVELDFQMYLSWTDPALVGVAVDDRPPYEYNHDRKDETPCWNPEVEVNNNVNLETLWAVYPPPYQGVEDGRVVWGARYRGCISNEIDLHCFPIDSDSVHITVGPKNATTDKVVLRIDPKKHRYSPMDSCVDRPGDRIKTVSLTEWNVDVPFVRRGLSGPTGSGSYYSNIEFIVIVHRNFMFYVWKVLIILLFLIFSSWMPLFQPAEDFGSRFSESLTLLLAAVAFLFVVNDSLPRISYLTVLDKAMLICFGAIFFIGLESFVVYLLVKPPSSSRSRSVAKIVDTHMRWIYPLLFIFAQSIVAWNAVNRRAKLISDPEAQWQLVAASGDSKLKEMPPTDDANDDHEDVKYGKNSREQRRATRITDVLHGSSEAAQRQRVNQKEETRA